ncbi:DUF1657 domain-containing protein [Peribacillus deserti]|uniref:DUF1657 domain-containing protein n=1 Tax=Peribacillus deserti TaxID=673318 RepID=A0A2N5MAJ7_9BACI|nr:DUF1657 domain-containing protein [Peribacillus deserti]PLT31392.1 hypothetical protein CUU66_02695 [Peribacillus deserti]
MTELNEIKKTLAAIKGIEAQLSIFALSSREEEAQIALHEAMVQAGQIKHDIQKRIYALERNKTS